MTILSIYLFISTLLNLANGDSLHWTICCSCLVFCYHSIPLSIPLSSPICLGWRAQAACQQQHHHHHHPLPCQRGWWWWCCETLRLECGCLNSSPVHTPLALMSTCAQGLRGANGRPRRLDRPPPLPSPPSHIHARRKPRSGNTVVCNTGARHG